MGSRRLRDGLQVYVVFQSNDDQDVSVHFTVKRDQGLGKVRKDTNSIF